MRVPNFTTPHSNSPARGERDIWFELRSNDRIFCRIRVNSRFYGDNLHSQLLFSEEMLFSQGIRAGEFVFSAQDGRRSNGELHETSAQDQALRTVGKSGARPENRGTRPRERCQSHDLFARLLGCCPGSAGAGGELRKERRKLSRHDPRRHSGSRRRLPSQDGCRSDIEQRPRSILPDGATTGSGQSLPRGSCREFLFLIRRRCG